MARETRVYDGLERPDVEVLVDGTWCPGELRAWIPDPHSEGWLANVQYRTEPGATRVDTVPADRVRLDLSDAGA